MTSSASRPEIWYIIPLLIEQPTWGGKYIAKFKGINHPQVTSKKIGQSFELAGESLLCPHLPKIPTFGLASATDVTHPTWFGELGDVISLPDLVIQDAMSILGKKKNQKCETLIKFTQAQNNSYQVHLSQGKTLGTWLPKPESWFFLEPGKATLGLSSYEKIQKYRQRCLEINTFACELVGKIKSSQISLETARQTLSAFISQDHPRQFVHTLDIKANQVVDLSQGGIHHSWERDTTLPLGNVVYEVQRDVKDEDCTLRAFDQGNIKDDGTIRTLTIDEYFSALDTDSEHNLPGHFLSNPMELRAEGETTLFHNEYYFSSLISLHSGESHQEKIDGDGFRHLFVQEGAITVMTPCGAWPVSKGWSVLLPAHLAHYQITTKSPARVIKTK